MTRTFNPKSYGQRSKLLMAIALLINQKRKYWQNIFM
jgi:hypothetical protein